jgi:hypothetical protein
MPGTGAIGGLGGRHRGSHEGIIGGWLAGQTVVLDCDE